MYNCTCNYYYRYNYYNIYRVYIIILHCINEIQCLLFHVLITINILFTAKTNTKQNILMCTMNNKKTFSIQMKEYVHVHVRTSKPQKYVNKVQVQVHVGLQIN